MENRNPSLFTSISQQVWDLKYRYRRYKKIIDLTIEDTWERIAKNIASVEPKKESHTWEKKFYEILEDFRFLPGGRIIAGAGTHKKVTLFNCFVMPIKKDSLRGIFTALAEGAYTLQQGGGVGYDFSILRPEGCQNRLTDSVASGPVSFMRIWDSMSATMQSSGARRGAMMANLRCDHPDVEQFIIAKSDPRELRQFNVSVIITDEFMQAVIENTDWPLVFPVFQKSQKDNGKTIYRRWSGSSEPVLCRIYKTVKARDLWEKIIKAAYSYAEPGVIFEDTINNYNTLWYCERISATNPCGEIPLPSYGACNLGSINLTQFIQNPYTKNAAIAWSSLENTTEIATQFLDNVIDISKFPLKAQREMAIKTRRIGLGFTGLADALVMLGVRYGSQKSFNIAHSIIEKISYVSWHTSARLAKQKSSFPLFKKKLYLKGKFVETLPDEIQQLIHRYGMRNSHHNAIAPTGTISLLANNVSNGIEPIFAEKFQRKVRYDKGEAITYTIKDYAYQCWQDLGKSGLPPEWISTHSIAPEEHLKMQSVIQPFIDNAISKTINLPVDFPYEKLTSVFTNAYKLGLKGCTIFRPNPVTGSVVEIDDIDKCCPI